MDRLGRARSYAPEHGRAAASRVAPDRRWLAITGAVAVLLGVLGLAFGTGYATSNVKLSDGGAWLGKGKRVVHVNGATGKPDAEAIRDLAKGTERIEVVTGPYGKPYVVNKDTGEVTRIDTTTMDVGAAKPASPAASSPPSAPDSAPSAAPSSSAPATAAGPADDVIVLMAKNRGYVIHKLSGQVELIDPVTLAVRGTAKIDGGVASAVVDEAGVAWVTTRLGTLVRVDGTAPGAPVLVGQAGDAVTVTLVNGAPVVTDQTAGGVRRVTGDGQLSTAVPVPAGPAAQVNQPAPGPFAWVLNGQTGVLYRIDFARGATDGVAVVPPGHVVGQPVVNGGLVYVPDQTGRVVVEVDARTLAIRKQVQVPGTGATFELVMSSGSVWASDPSDSRAVSFDQNGNDRTVDKGSGGPVTDANTSAPTPTPPADPSPAATVPAAPPSSSGGHDNTGSGPGPQPGTVPAAPTGPPVAPPTTVGGTPTLPTPPPSVPAPLPTVPVTPSTPPSTSASTLPKPPPTANANVVVPDLTGKTSAQACAALVAAQLQCGSAKQQDGQYERTVLATQPAANTSVRTGTSVTPMVDLRLPNLVGTDKDVACGRLQKVGLVCAANPVKYVSGQTKNQVSAEAPKANTQVADGATVKLDYYGDLYVKVPDLNNGALTFTQACNQLKGQSLDCNATPKDAGVAPAGKKAGMVVGQSVAPGTDVPAKTKLVLTVTTKVAVPDLTGKTPAQANAALAAVGLGAGTVTVTTAPNPTAPLNSITAQTVAKDTAVAAGAKVGYSYYDQRPLIGTVNDTYDYVTHAYAAANDAAPKVATYHNGDKVTIVCQTKGAGWTYVNSAGVRSTWYWYNKLSTGGYTTVGEILETRQASDGPTAGIKRC